MTAPLSRDLKVLAAMFVGSGVTHLVRPKTFEPVMPNVVPAHREVILASGVLELACAAGLLHPRTRRVAGWTSAALLVAVFPANVKMANDARTSSSQVLRLGMLARLPMQIPLVRTALKAARA